MSTNENTPISGQFWDWMQSYWHSNRDFPPAHPDWRKKADLVNGKVPAGQLPSYVDDVLEFDSYPSLPQPGEKGKIYITTKDNKQFRWGGSAYVEINSSEKVGSKIINGSYNANDLSTNSITYGYSVANAPSTVGAHSFSILNLDTTNPNYKMQLGFDGDTNEMFSRIKSNGHWTDWSKYTTSSQLENLLTTNTGQDVTAQKWFKNTSGISNWNDNKLVVAGLNGSKGGITFYSEAMDIGTLDFDGYYHFKTTGGYTNIKSGGFLRNGSDNNYVLLGGGGHAPLSDFAFSNQLITYEDNRLIYPNELEPTKLRYGFTSYENDGGGHWADFLHFGGYPDASGGNQNLIVFKRNGGFGIRQYQAPWQSSNPYSDYVDYWHSGNLENYHQYGLGQMNVHVLPDLNTYSTNKTGFYSINLSSNSPYDYGTVIKIMRVAEEGTEIATSVWGNGLSFRGYVGSSYTPWREVWHSGNLNPVTLDTPQTIIHQKTFNSGIAVTSGQKINLAGYGDPAHYITRFNDDTDGFGVSTGFAVKPYNNYNQNLFLVNSTGAYVQDNLVATQAWINSLLRINRKKTYFFDVTTGLSVYRLYLPQDTGTYGLTVKIRSDYANYNSTGLTEFKINYGKAGSWIFHQDFYCSALIGNVRSTIYLQPQILYDSTLDKPYINVHKFVPLLNPINLEVEVVTKNYNANLNDTSLTFVEDAGATVLDLRNKNENFLTSGANYKLNWDGISDDLYRDDVLIGYLLTSQNISNFGFVTYSNLSTQLEKYAALNGVQTFTNTNTFTSSPVIPNGTLGTHAVNLNQLSSALNNYFNKFAINYTGSNHDLNTLSQTGFYTIAYGALNSGNYTGSRDGQRALLHLETENVYSASQIQTERYNGNIVSRTRADGGWSNWVRHWGDNDFTAADVSKWNNSISKSSASEEVILEDDTLKIQPDELSLEGSSSYDIVSRKKLVHVLLREGKEVNIRELVRRQTMVVFNFSKDPVSLNIEGLKPYALSPGMQVTLYISDEREVLLYNETGFKKLQ